MKTTFLTPAELKARGIKLIQDHPIIQPESAIAHKRLDGLRGVEIGPSAYQPFGLDTIAVATPDPKDRELYRGIELVVCGGYVEMDAYAEADTLPFPDHSQDFVLSSHVIEHTPSPIACFVEWQRVVKSGGYIFMIVPKRENPYGDTDRIITPIEYFLRAYDEHWTLGQAFERTPDKSAQPRNRGHLWVFNLMSMIWLVDACNHYEYIHWTLEEAQETDDKDGEGHLLVYRVE
jgi:SAM-dependent methyltransferase